MAKKQLKKCSTSLVIILGKIAKMKNLGDSRCAPMDVDKEELSAIVGGIVNWYNHSGNKS